MNARERRIAALYVQRGGAYWEQPGIDPWDEARDARRYAGPHPVVAHPPCSRWSRLAGLVQARWGHRIGDDGGTFEAALAAVRRWGGVLEHPAHSRAWARYDLRHPVAGRWLRDLLRPREWVCEVSQAAYGHPARKLTWLLFVGDREPLELDWSRPSPRACVSYLTRRGDGSAFKAFTSPGERLTKCQASATPPAFRDALLSLARWAQ